MKKDNVTKKSNKLYLIILCVFIVISAGVGFACFKYYASLKNSVKDESKNYMMEISKLMENNVVKSLNDNFSALDTIAVALANLGTTNFDELKETVELIKEKWNYSKIMLVDESGKSFDEKGDIVQLSGREYLLSAIIDKKATLSSSESIDGKECIVFIIPTDITISADNEIIKMPALAAAYELSTFDKILSMEAFDGLGYAHIIRKDGVAVVRSSANNAFQGGYNFLNSLEAAVIKDSTPFHQIRTDIQNGKKGFIEFSIEDFHEYMTYAPLDTKIESDDWRLLTFVPVDAVNVKSSLMLTITLLMSLFITVTFALLLWILITVTYRNRKKLERIAYVDEVTLGNTIQYFYEKANKVLQKSDNADYAMVYTNIVKFKLFNELYGRKKCDEVLKIFYDTIYYDIHDDECLGRLFADNFCMLVKNDGDETLIKRISDWRMRFEKAKAEANAPVSFNMVFGIYVITNKELALSSMIDRAKLASLEPATVVLDNVKVIFYDEMLRKQLLREKHLEDNMQAALVNQEFQVYLQPKYNAKTRKIEGAEALTRWVSADEGMIYPDEFISLFERNGFIIKLDLYVFDVVCKLIRKWLNDGLMPVKISVNCSRAHLKSADFLKYYEKIAIDNNVPRKYLELEFTENLVFGDVDRFSKIISQVHRAGFGCSMDDFGSGYSSLNLIQEIPVDTLKLDKVFFKKRIDKFERTEAVVSSIISMAKSLQISTVAEGVEEEKQVEMLDKLGCDLIQGYYFAKPMPIVDFENKLFKGESK